MVIIISNSVGGFKIPWSPELLQLTKEKLLNPKPTLLGLHKVSFLPSGCRRLAGAKKASLEPPLPLWQKGWSIPNHLEEAAQCHLLWLAIVPRTAAHRQKYTLVPKLSESKLCGIHWCWNVFPFQKAWQATQCFGQQAWCWLRQWLLSSKHQKAAQNRQAPWFCWCPNQQHI